jgi:hypothetical protein
VSLGIYVVMGILYVSLGIYVAMGILYVSLGIYAVNKYQEPHIIYP